MLVPLPEMTLEQAIELAAKYTTIEGGLVDLFMRQNNVDSLLDYACHAAKACIVLLKHAHETEQALAASLNNTDQVAHLLQRMQAAVVGACSHSHLGGTIKAILEENLALSGGNDGVSHPNQGGKTEKEPEISLSVDNMPVFRPNRAQRRARSPRKGK